MSGHIKVCALRRATPEKYGLRISANRGTLVVPDAGPVRHSLRLRQRRAAGAHGMRLDSQLDARHTERLTTFRGVAPLHIVEDIAPPESAVALSPRVWRVLGRMALVALAYYVGARIGFLLQSPRVPQSVLWLPNSILFAVLVVSPVRSWALLLAASYPAQLLVGWQTHAPLVTMSLLYLTNCADAVLAAAVWRLLSPGQSRIYGLRPMLAFLVAAAAVPTLLISFADAAITVARHWSNNYWLVFETRARANVLTNVIFVPAAVWLLSETRSEFVNYWRRRWIEGVMLTIGLVSTTLVALSRPTGSISSAGLAYLPLAFVVWAAVRFNVAMTGVTLLTLGYLTTWMGIHGVGNVTPLSPDNFVPTVQFELLAIAVPVLCLCAVIQERERASSALAASQRALNQSLAQIRNLAGRLLSATEIERTRIARELHDDICQQLAAIGIGLSALKRRLPNDLPLRDEVNALQLQAMRAAEDIRVLSHDLHPAALRHAGLVPAMRELCAQYDRGEKMRAVLSVKRDVEVSHDVAVCVYRVTQEALHNAARHSGARTIQVSLRAHNDGLELLIEDDGRGFEEQTARRQGGLGLTSMDERARLVGGNVRVDSVAGRGTRINLRIPNRDFHGSADITPG